MSGVLIPAFRQRAMLLASCTLTPQNQSYLHEALVTDVCIQDGMTIRFSDSLLHEHRLPQKHTLEQSLGVQPSKNPYSFGALSNELVVRKVKLERLGNRLLRVLLLLHVE